MGAPPDIPTRAVNVGGVVLFLGLAIGSLAIAVDPREGGLALQVIGIIGVPLCVVAAVRAAMMTVRLSDDAVVVRNFLSTRRIPLARVVRFTSQVTRTHNGPTLSIETSDGALIVATAYPLTNVPPIRTRRQGLISSLNDWLNERR